MERKVPKMAERPAVWKCCILRQHIEISGFGRIVGKRQNSGAKKKFERRNVVKFGQSARCSRAELWR